MTTQSARSHAATPSDEEQIRRQVEDWGNALRAKDRDKLTSFYTPDFLAFDLAPPLVHQLADVKTGLAEWFSTWQGPIGFDVRDLAVTCGSDVAFTTSLNHISGKRTSGETTDIWVRATVCFRKSAGAWKVVHEHVSVPFYMDGSYRAAVDLKP
jgi:PhnB protein